MLDAISEIYGETNYAPVFVHADIMPIAVAKGIDVRKVFATKNQDVLETFYVWLKEIVGTRDLWLPSFNYDFCKGKPFDIAQTPSQVGSLPEFFRTQKAAWRSAMPVFSFCGTGPVNPFWLNNKVLDPFSKESDFHELYKKDGFILFYGVNFSPTYSHYVERIHKEGPLYRYDKLFKGSIIKDQESFEVTMNYHVIPRGLKINYDMPRLQDDLFKQGLLKKLSSQYPNCLLIKAKDLCHFWLEKMNEDPLYLLDLTTKVEVEKILHKLGRRFIIQDFDDNHNI